MDFERHRLRTLRAGLGLFILAAGCQTSNWKREIVYSRSPVAIFLEREEPEGVVAPKGFAHPYEISPEALESLLGNLRFRSWGVFQGTAVRPVFEEAEIAALVSPLSDGLKRAGADERVRFLVARTEWRPLFLGPQGTSGVVFLTSPGELNVAFDMIHEGLDEESGDPRAVVFTRDPVEITGRTPEIETPRGIAVRGGAPEGKLYPRWIVADPAVLPSLEPVEPVASASRPQGGGSRRVAVREPVPPPASPPAPPAQAVEAAPPPQPVLPLAETAGDPEAEAIRLRLKALEGLLQSGAISAEEYELARREVLLQSER